MKWLYHLTTGDAPSGEPFVHCSYKDDLAETRRLHFANVPERDLRLIRVDPRRVADVRVEGPRMMPHVYGEIAKDAWTLSDNMEGATDLVTGTKFAVVGFARMTLLDLVGVLDPLGRVVTMDVDRDAKVEVVSATDEPWSAFGADFFAKRVRPSLEDFDVLVVAGGPETRALENDPRVVDWLRTFPENRMATSVCTGALLLGAAGRLRGKRATTHHASLDLLAKHGATAVPRTRVVRDGQLMTAGGVTSAMDLGLAIVEWLYGSEPRARIAARMEYPSAP